MIIKNKILVALGCSALSCLTAAADTTQTVTVSGETLTQSVTKITFDGDNVVLTLSDATTQTVDMAEVSIALAYSATDGIDNLPVAEQATVGDQRVYNLKGQYVGNSLQGLSKGIYITNGKKVVVK